MELEAKVRSMEQLYDATRSVVYFPDSYRAALPSMLEKTEPILGKWSERLLGRLCMKAPGYFEGLLPEALQNTREFLDMGYTQREAAYLAVTISPREVRNLELELRLEHKNSGLHTEGGPDRIAVLAKFMIKSAIAPSPRNRQKFKEKAKTLTANYNLVYAEAKRTDPKRAASFTYYAFTKHEPLRALQIYRSTYDKIRDKYYSMLMELTKRYDEIDSLSKLSAGDAKLKRKYSRLLLDLADFIAIRSFHRKKVFLDAKNICDGFFSILNSYVDKYGGFAWFIARQAIVISDHHGRAKKIANGLDNIINPLREIANVGGEDLTRTIIRKVLTSEEDVLNPEHVFSKAARLIKNYSRVHAVHSKTHPNIAKTLAQICMSAENPLRRAKEVAEEYERLVKSGKRSPSTMLFYADKEEGEIRLRERRIANSKGGRKKTGKSEFIAFENERYGKKNGKWHKRGSKDELPLDIVRKLEVRLTKRKLLTYREMHPPSPKRRKSRTQNLAEATSIS